MTEVKKRKFPKAIIVILVNLLVVCGIFVAFYKTSINIPNVYAEMYDINLNKESNETSNEKSYMLKEYVTNDLKTATFTFNFNKDFIYDRLLSGNINKDLKESYNLEINQIGYRIDENDNSIINIYIDFITISNQLK